MVFKIDKNKNYTVMGNYHLRDKELSLKAKGLLSYMLSLPEDWDYSIQGLVAICKESRDTIKSTLNELKKYNYLKIEKTKNAKGHFEYLYLIYEKPITLEKDLEYNPGVEKPPLDKPNVENYLQINTNNKILNNNEDKEDKVKSSFFNESEYNYLTINLLKRNYINECDDLYLYDDLFDELLRDGNMQSELLKISNYIISKVKDRKSLDEYGNQIENKYGYFRESIKSNIRKLNINPDSLFEDIYNDFER